MARDIWIRSLEGHLQEMEMQNALGTATTYDILEASEDLKAYKRIRRNIHRIKDPLELMSMKLDLKLIQNKFEDKKYDKN